MTGRPDWLPEALRYSDFGGDWDRFLKVVYGVFQRDFKQSRPCFQGRPVAFDSRIEAGKEAAFWHIVCRDDRRTRKREVDIRRCERIPWPRPLIEHPADSAVAVWRNERKGQTRILIWLEGLDYLVVLADRRNAVVLVTAYCTDIESQRRKLRKERDEYSRMQKPPW